MYVKRGKITIFAHFLQRFLAPNIALATWMLLENGTPVFIAQIRTKAMMSFAAAQNFTNIVAQKKTKLFNPRFKSKYYFSFLK